MSERLLEIDHVAKEYRLGMIGGGMLYRDINSWIARKLGKEDIVKILDIEMNGLKKRLSRKGLEMNLAKEAVAFLADKGFNPAYGARPLRRTVERFVQDPLAEEILKGTLTRGVVNVALTQDKKALAFTMTNELPVEGVANERKTENGRED